MRISDATEYPVEGMEVIFNRDTGLVYQVIFIRETFGIFTRIFKRWRGLTSDDVSLNDCSVMDVLPEDMRVVRDLWDEAQMSGRTLFIEDFEEWEVIYRFDESVA